jgi:hypothetical protein
MPTEEGVHTVLAIVAYDRYLQDLARGGGVIDAHLLRVHPSEFQSLPVPRSN